MACGPQIDEAGCNFDRKKIGEAGVEAIFGCCSQGATATVLKQPSVKTAMGSQWRPSFGPAALVDSDQYSNSGGIEVPEVNGSDGGRGGDEVVEVAGPLPEGIAGAVGDRSVECRLPVPSAKAVVGVVVLQHENRPSARPLRGYFAGQRGCNRVAAEVIQRDSSLEQSGFSLAQIVEAFLVTEYLQRALPCWRRSEFPAAARDQKRVDGLKVGPACRVTFVSGEGEGREPGLSRPNTLGGERIGETGGARKRWITGPVPSLAGKVERPVVLESPQRIEKQLAQIRHRENFRMDAQKGGTQFR